MKKRLSRNLLMEWMRKLSPFQKFLCFFLPFIASGVVYLILTSAGSLPGWLVDGIYTIFLWGLTCIWAYLIVNAQIHWSERRRDFVGNITTGALAIVWLLVFIFG